MSHSIKYFFLLGFIGVLLTSAGTFFWLKEQEKKVQKTPIASLLDDVPQDTAPQHVASSSAVVVKVPILMYHYIEHVKDPGDTFRQKLNIFPETLALQLKVLSENGYSFIRMSDVADAVDGKKKLPSKPIVLTFDDGYRDFYTSALPVLEKYKVPATAYIITGFINRPNNLTLAQLKSLGQNKLIEIGAHTVHHIDLNHASLEKATAEIIDSKTYLEKLLERPVTTFAYPSGRFDQQAVKIVQQAGFSTAVSTMPGVEASVQNRFILFRLRPGSRTGQALLTFLKQMSE